MFHIIIPRTDYTSWFSDYEGVSLPMRVWTVHTGCKPSTTDDTHSIFITVWSNTPYPTLLYSTCSIFYLHTPSCKLIRRNQLENCQGMKMVLRPHHFPLAQPWEMSGCKKLDWEEKYLYYKCPNITATCMKIHHKLPWIIIIAYKWCPNIICPTLCMAISFTNKYLLSNKTALKEKCNPSLKNPGYT